MYDEVINLYKQAFPQTEHEADSGYILRDGTVIDISNTDMPYCHGCEFSRVESLRDWRSQHQELPMSSRMLADTISQDLGAIEFTIDNCHIQTVRLPNKSMTAEQKQPLSEIISRILERGFIRVETLGMGEYAEYDAKDYSAEDVMREIESRNL